MAAKITRCAVCNVRASDTRPSDDGSSAPIPVCEPCGHILDTHRLVKQVETMMGTRDAVRCAVKADEASKLAMRTAWTGRQTNMAFSARFLATKVRNDAGKAASRPTA